LKSYGFFLNSPAFRAAPLIVFYGEAPEGQRRYSPAVCTGAHKHRIEGKPIPSTSARRLWSVKIFRCALAASIHPETANLPISFSRPSTQKSRALLTYTK
jgi:hypothetical protein